MNETKRQSPLGLLLLVGALALAAVLWAVWRLDSRPTAPGVAMVAPVLEPKDADKGVHSVSASARVVVPRRTQPGQEDVDSAEIERRRGEAMIKREADFVAEPRDAAWATHKVALIDRALAPASLAQFGAATPRNTEVDCRSNSCRITADFDDLDQAELGQFAIASGIGGELSGSQTFFIDQAGGSQRMFIYAVAAPPGKPKTR